VVGALRHRVDLQLGTETRDSYGGSVVTWETVATRWAEVKEVSSETTFVADQQQRTVKHEVLMRYYTGLDQAIYRLVYQGRVIRIDGLVNEDGRKIWHKVFGIEAVDLFGSGAQAQDSRLDLSSPWNSGYVSLMVR
jgi:SPP1 family predicted phage head-tail adaptor